jgi:cell division septum initiation protein DivIVA
MVEEKDYEKAGLVDAIKRLERHLASLTTEFTDAEVDLKRQVADVQKQLEAAVARASKLQGDALAANKTIDDVRCQESAEDRNAELLDRLRKVEHHCEGYRTTANEQQKIIEKLSDENAKLVSGLGRQHINHSC